MDELGRSDRSLSPNNILSGKTEGVYSGSPQEGEFPETENVRKALQDFKDKGVQDIEKKYDKIKKVCVGVGIGVAVAVGLGIWIAVTVITAGAGAPIIAAIVFGMGMGGVGAGFSWNVVIPISFVVSRILDRKAQEKIEKREEEARLGFAPLKQSKSYMTPADMLTFCRSIKELNLGLQFDKEAKEIFNDAKKTFSDGLQKGLEAKGAQLDKSFLFSRFVPALVPDKESATHLSKTIAKKIYDDRLEKKSKPTLIKKELGSKETLQQKLEEFLDKGQFEQALTHLQELYLQEKNPEHKKEYALQCALLEKKVGNKENACAFFEHYFLYRIGHEEDKAKIFASKDFLEYVKTLVSLDKPKAERYFLYHVLSCAAQGRLDHPENTDYSAYFSSDVSLMFDLFAASSQTK